jgi:hypothetical protein
VVTAPTELGSKVPATVVAPVGAVTTLVVLNRFEWTEAYLLFPKQ